MTLNPRESRMHTAWADGLLDQHNNPEPEEEESAEYCSICEEDTEPGKGTFHLDECSKCGGDYGSDIGDLVEKLNKQGKIAMDTISLLEEQRHQSKKALEEALNLIKELVPCASTSEGWRQDSSRNNEWAKEVINIVKEAIK